MRRALYREYRPRSLSEVIGQSHVTSALEKSLKANKVSHAYLFIGPRGTGKTSVARILAHEINGFEYELEDEHLDIIEIDAASNTGVDNIRSLRENAIIAPTKGKYKIYIIDEVHMLSKSAFNALLKTLEEPPEHVIFVMATTDAHKVPITITSRSQTYTFKLATPDIIASHLAHIAKTEKINIADDALKLIAKRGGGSFRDSISLLDQISTSATGEITCELLEDAFGLPSDQLVNQLLTAYSTGDLTCARTTLQDLLEQGIKPETIAEDMIASIVIDPKSEFLPLLNQLLDISSSTRPEVKLLLALLNTPPKTVLLDGGSATELGGDSALRDDGSGENVATARNDGPAPSPSSEKSAVEPSSITTSWPQLLDVIKKDNAALYSLLARTTGQYHQNTLKIHIKNKMVRNKIDQKLKYLASFLPEDTIIEITDQPATASDPLISDLSSIFGDVEEVELEHE
ncbi:DNA polymerase III subunit gamma/tau [Candidatus Saccharibacteria bacterium]|nr:DNA polymerase III subunit gamma/tau [Candidatus Saccharibacteria bacterium]